MTGIPTAALIACAVIVLALGALLSAGESALLGFTRAAADERHPPRTRGLTGRSVGSLLARLVGGEATHFVIAQRIGVRDESAQPA